MKVFTAMIILTAMAAATAGSAGKSYRIKEDLNNSKSNWSFNIGREFPGASGQIIIGKEKEAEGGSALSLTTDFSGGGSYTGATRKFPSPTDIQGIVFKIKTAAPRIGLRVVDSGGQTHQQYIPLSGKDREWQNVEIRPIGGKGAQFIHWGGAGDGTVKQPLKSLMFIVSKGEVAGNRWSTLIKDICWISAKPPALRMRQIEPQSFFMSPDNREPLKIAVEEIDETASLNYFYTDYNGNRVSEGFFSAVAGGKVVAVPRPQKSGFYDLNIPSLKLVVGVVVTNPVKGEPDPFFAVDGALSCFSPFRNDALADSYLKILRQSGIGWIRDRIHWKRLETKHGQYDWAMRESNGENLRRLYTENKIKVLDTFHEAPDWAGSVNSATEKYPYPRDLVATAASWGEIMRHWHDCGALEVWNEPDINFGASLPGDHLSAVQKAVSYGLKKNNIFTPLVGGVFTGSCIEPAFMNIYLENGLIEDTDIFSFHNYDVPEYIPSVVAKFRHLLRNSPKSQIPFWITESGQPWSGGTDRAKLQEDKNSAFGIVMKAVEAKACGVEKFFAFVYPFYKENVKNFGMMDKNHTPMRSLAAYSYCARVLAHKQYIGDLKGTGCYFSRVFSDGRDAVAVLASRTPDRAVTWPKGLQVSNLTGADGRILSTVGGKIRIDSEPIYLFTSASVIKPFLNSNTVQMKLLQAALQYRPVPRKTLPAVFFPDLNLHQYPYSLYGYLIDNPEHADMAVKIANLSDHPLTVRPAIGATPAAVISGAEPGRIEIPARSERRIVFHADIRDALKKQDAVKIKFSDLNGNASPLVITLLDNKKESFLSSPFSKINQIFDFSTLDMNGWKVIPAKQWRNWGPGQSASNIKAKFRICWTPEKLQLQVLVEDPNFSQPYPINNAWQGDSVQAAFYTLTPNVTQQNFSEITAAQTSSGPAIFRHSSISGKKAGSLTKSKLQFFSRGNQYLYVIDLDAGETELGKLEPGTKLRLSLLVNSNQGAGREGYLYWGDGISLSKNPKELNIVELTR